MLYYILFSSMIQEQASGAEGRAPDRAFIRGARHQRHQGGEPDSGRRALRDQEELREPQAVCHQQEHSHPP